MKEDSELYIRPTKENFGAAGNISFTVSHSSRDLRVKGVIFPQLHVT